MVGADEDYVWIASDRGSVCQSCSARVGCGQKLLGQITASGSGYLKIANTIGAKTGDKVTVGIAENTLLLSSLLVYLIPLVAMALLAGMVDALWVVGEGVIIAAGASGFLLGFLLVKQLSSKLSCNPDYHPQLIEKVI